MHVVWSWLQELIDIDRDVSVEEAAATLTGAGLEVEDLQTLGDDFSGVVVAEVVGKRKHPNADKLTLVELVDSDGGTKTEVVCGASNVPDAGGRVLWAKPGAELPGGFKISPKKLKGVVSAGMICSEKELNLGDDHDGIIVLAGGDASAALGASAQDALRLREVVFEVNSPANRPDAHGHLGIAFELAALLGGRARPLDISFDGLVDDGLSAADLCTVTIEDEEGCPRYTARIIDGVSVRPSPQWMRQRLRAVGVRPLSNLIDVTNYVMFETGQPLHAFDYAHVGGSKILVRRASAGEKMKTLDDIERTLTTDDIVICDGNGPVALGGVMGGLDSEVRDDTTRVLLESASFKPINIRRTAKRLGLHSESSHRFERSVDANGADMASARAAKLLAELGGGRIAQGMVDQYPRKAEPVSVRVRASRATQLTGVDIDAAKATETLELLGLDVSPVAGSDDALDVVCPTRRPDLTREVDLIEEIIRVYGFDKVPATLPVTTVAPSQVADQRPHLARRALVGIGMSEAVTFGFTSPDRVSWLGLAADDRRSTPIVIKNPMTVDQSVMRPSLLCNLLGATARNLSFGVSDIQIFEIGSVFLSRGDNQLADEPVRATGVVSGSRPGWLVADGSVGFYDLKGIVERLMVELLGAANARLVRYTAISDVPYLHPGVAARVELADGTYVGEIGEVHPSVRDSYGIEPACFAFDLDLNAFPVPGPAQLVNIPKYPAITRDISFFVGDQVPASRVDELITANATELVEHVTVLEEYRDAAKVPEGQKGMLWSITYRSGERTLTDAEVDATHEAIVAKLLDELPAQRR